MVSTEQLHDIAFLGQTKTMEFKRAANSRRKAAHTLCAMVNHREGCMLFRVAPEGKMLGQQVYGCTAVTFRDMRFRSISGSIPLQCEPNVGTVGVALWHGEFL